MIKLKSILNEQDDSFKSLIDAYMVMKNPVRTGGYGSYNPEVGGFTFNSDDTVATKQYNGSELKLVWRGSNKFNVFYYNKNQGVFTFDSFQDWLEGLTKNMPVDELTSLGFKQAKDPVTGYNSYVKIIKTFYNDTASSKYLKGLWSCDTVIRVFAQTANKWMIRAQIGQFYKSGLDTLIYNDVTSYSTDLTGTRKGRNVTKKSWLTGSEYEDFEQITPEIAAREWKQNTGQAIQRVQKVNATSDKLISTVEFMETNIRKYKGLVGPYNDSNFKNNYLLNIAKNINK